ncbi:glycosyltransferase family 4 protein [Chitinophaga arvensicola]|uniref:Glycosyltransferase involved in cell wall bisynthesis n=1 Tax=Chitinophaga arvensicola TaxID=29529 RepID=A0A1I0SDS9_9BACT|nr:glycosyltransferase family 4 protein [Chitinophaga arvensicola]SEW54176.1 Glycosyltransferase involved in cell wall bisynthesis [Chitinophaga arvensicola]
MYILFFTDISPFPQNGGERIRSYYLIKALSQLGYEVVAVVRNVEKVDLQKYHLPNVIFYTYETKPFDLLTRITGKQYFQRTAAVMEIFEEICREYPLAAAVLDYGFVGHYISYFRRQGIPVILGTHNAQPMITWQLPSKGLVDKLRKWQLFSMEKLHERMYFNKAAAVLVVSDDDNAYHTRFLPKQKVFTVPNFLDEKDYRLFGKKQQRVLVMTANFGVYMNFAGLKWFIENVWDEALAGKYDLWLVGRGSKEALKKITGKDEYRNIAAFGKVDDVKWYISVASAVIIPLVHGSGTRLKCLEAMALSTPIISTRKGVEGVKSEHFIVSDEPGAFRQSLLSFDPETDRGAKLREDFLEEYSLDVNRERLQQIVHYAVRGKMPACV